MSAAPVSAAAGLESAEAANDLFERYHDRIYAFCMSRTRNPADAEDATQTAFMHALNGLRRGVVPQFELTWLLRIAENVCHSMHRRAYRRYERDELPTDVVSGQEDMSLVTGRYEALCHAVESLPDQQRRAILLREWRGLSYDDIAEELGLSHAAVETTIFRARRSLIKQLGSLAAFPFPAIGRLAQWLAGPAGAKAAAVAVVTIGSATAVVSSSPAEVLQTTPAEQTGVATPKSESRATAARPTVGAVGTESGLAPGAVAPSALPAEPPHGTAAGERSTPASPIAPRIESPTSQPGAVSDVPTVLPLPVAPAVATELPETIVELADDVVPLPPVELPQVELPQVELLQVELPPLVPALPLP